MMSCEVFRESEYVRKKWLLANWAMIVAKSLADASFSKTHTSELHSETSAKLVVFVTTTIPRVLLFYFLEMHFMMKNEILSLTSRFYATPREELRIQNWPTGGITNNLHNCQ